MKIKLTLGIIFLILMAMVVHSIVTVRYINPIDEFYLIKGGTGNITFIVNATPSGISGIIKNISLYHNISGTWGVNFTDQTIATIGTATSRQFLVANTSIFSSDLTDGLVFIWNAVACDNKSSFIEEDVALVPDVFTVFDNYTDGSCGTGNLSCVVITAGRGRVINYPLSSLDGVANTTSEGLLTGACKLNGSTDGYFYCNQTITNYNYTGVILSTETLITSSVKVNYTITTAAKCRFVGANRTVYVEDSPDVTLIVPSDNGYVTDGTILFNYNVTGDSAT